MRNELLSDELSLVENRLYNLFQADNSVLAEIDKFLKAPSKRIRSRFALLYLKANGVNVSDDIISVLTAGELIHNASLIHDDFVDSADLRRNDTTFHKKFNPRIAVLAGDFLLSLAGEVLISINNRYIDEKFYSVAKAMAEAEIEQQILSNSQPDKDAYLSICNGKTAKLFSVLVESCALLSNIDTVKAAKIGELFGMIFQFKNDIEPSSAEIDKQNGIFTAIDIFGIEKTNALIDNYKEEILGLITDFPNDMYRRELEELIRGL